MLSRAQAQAEEFSFTLNKTVRQFAVRTWSVYMFRFVHVLFIIFIPFVFFFHFITPKHLTKILYKCQNIWKQVICRKFFETITLILVSSLTKAQIIHSDSITIVIINKVNVDQSER